MNILTRNSVHWDKFYIHYYDEEHYIVDELIRKKDFSEKFDKHSTYGRLVVSLAQHSGRIIIDKNGNPLYIKNKYLFEYASPFVDGIAAVSFNSLMALSDKTYHCIDTYGNILYSSSYLSSQGRFNNSFKFKKENYTTIYFTKFGIVSHHRSVVLLNKINLSDFKLFITRSFIF